MGALFSPCCTSLLVPSKTAGNPYTQALPPGKIEVEPLVEHSHPGGREPVIFTRARLKKNKIRQKKLRNL
jgi:hypothetical protein